jgi:hypothetical protein
LVRDVALDSVTILTAQKDAETHHTGATMVAMLNIVRQKNTGQQEPAFERHDPNFHACQERLVLIDESVGAQTVKLICGGGPSSFYIQGDQLAHTRHIRHLRDKLVPDGKSCRSRLDSSP